MLPQPQTWPWLALLFLLLIVYIIATEIQSQDCDQRLCYNTTPPSEIEDNPETMIEKMVTTLRVNHNPVEWRKALLVGLIVSFLTFYILDCCLTLSNFILIALIVFILVYFASTWTNWMYWRKIDNWLERRLLHFRSHA